MLNHHCSELQRNTAEVRPAALVGRRIRGVGDEREKLCTRCDEWWPADAEFFRPRSTGSRRLLCWCRACEAEQKREARDRRRAAVPELFE